MAMKSGQITECALRAARPAPPLREPNIGLACRAELTAKSAGKPGALQTLREVCATGE